MKKTLLFLMALLTLGVGGAWAATYTATYSIKTYSSEGTFSNNKTVWTSNGTPRLTMTYSGSNVYNTDNGRIFKGNYTLSVPEAYVITAYSITGHSAWNGSNGDVERITPATGTITDGDGNTVTYLDFAGSDVTLNVSDVNSQSVSFTMAQTAGSGNGAFDATAITVTIQDVEAGTKGHVAVNIANTSTGSLPTAFGSFSEQTFTTSDASGFSGVTITASSGLTIGEETVNSTHYGKCFRLVTSAAGTDYTVTMTAPEGYVIIGYYLDCSANTSNAPHTLTSADGNVSVVASAPPYNNPTGPKPFEVTGLNTQSTYFTINTASSGNTLYLPTFIIKLRKPNTFVFTNYIVLLDGAQVASVSNFDDNIGANPSLPTSLQKPYCTYSYFSDEACTEPVTELSPSSTVYAKCTFTPPFAVSSSLSDATWHYAKLRGHYVYYDAEHSDIRTNQSSKETTAAYHWAFFGNPYSGIKVANRSTGRYLDNTSNYVQFSDNGYNWTLAELNSTTFGLFNGSNYINEQNTGDHHLIYWWQFNGDTGSQWNVEPVTLDVTYNVLLEAGGSVVATATETKTSGGDFTLNLPSSAVRPFCTYSYYEDEACSQVITSTSLDGVQTVYALAKVNTPFIANQDKYYYLKLRNHYVFYDETNNNVCTTQSSKEKADAYRWSFSGDPYNGIKVKNKLTGTYLDNTSSNVQLTENGYAWTINSLPSNANTFGLKNGSDYINEQNHSNHYLIYWWQFDGDTGSQFLVEDVEPESNMFYRIKAGVSGKYITGNLSSYNSFLALSENADNTTIIYFDGDKLLNYSNGLYSASTSAQAAVGGTGDSYTISGSTNRPGYYTIYSTTSQQYMYDSGNTSGRLCVDRQGSLGGNNTDWQLEAVTSLPVTISAAGFASFYSPVALTLPEGLKAYVGEIDGDVLRLTVTAVIPANAGVILEGAAGDYNLTVGGTSELTSDITGSAATITASSVGEEVLTLTSADGKPAFYTYRGENLQGFKGYILASSLPSGVKALTVEYLADAIAALQAEKTAGAKNIFDLNGRRVERVQRGMYIVNGRKVIIK